MQYLYLGFTQDANMRCYRFQGVARERTAIRAADIYFTLSADMGLLNEHHIRFQDGPALCLEILTSALADLADTSRFAAYKVTREDLNAYMSARHRVEASKPPRRRPRPQYKSPS